MTLELAIIDFSEEHLTANNDWYEWKSINPKYLPLSVVLPQGNQYTQNVSLKTQLNDLYTNQNATDAEKQALTHYYIAIWGGVKRNRLEKIQSYALSAPAELIANGSTGIASWSKALCIRNPNIYAIYDARIAVSLNSLQIIRPVNNPQLFPLLTGQNKRINNGSKLIRQYATNNHWTSMQKNQFYQEYNQILSGAANALEVSVYTLEMLLFSKSLELLGAAFPT
jgi:hypothetical protein